MADNKNVFEIGLAMAGAISAGAYSAGVVDFLFQALRRVGTLTSETIPMTCPIIPSAFGRLPALRPDPSPRRWPRSPWRAACDRRRSQDPKQRRAAVPMRLACALQGLGDHCPTWHRRSNPTTDLLANDDLKDGGAPQSILNAGCSRPLRARRSSCPLRPLVGLPSGLWRGSAALFRRTSAPLSDAFELARRALCRRLRGQRHTHGHYMMSHGDRAHYILEGIGTHRGENAWLSEDNGDPLKITTVPRADKARIRPMRIGSGMAARRWRRLPSRWARGSSIETNVDKYEARAWPSLPGWRRFPPTLARTPGPRRITSSAS